jgi:hypothetical protein
MIERPGGNAPSPADIDQVLDRAVVGVPPWRRRRVRRELAGYVEDAVADLLDEGMPPQQALATVRRRFGQPEMIAAGFKTVPPPQWARGVRRTAAPMGTIILGLVLGMALVQARTPGRTASERSALAAAVLAATPDQERLTLLHVREVDQARVQAPPPGSEAGYQVASRLGVTRNEPRVLEPSVPAASPAWLPDGFDPAGGAVFLTASATVQFFARRETDLAGIVVETLRPDRSTVFQVKERHVFPVQVGTYQGFYIDGEWEVRGPVDEQPAPAAWRTDRSHSLLFARDGLLVLVAGPADVLDLEGLLRIARSLR